MKLELVNTSKVKLDEADDVEGLSLSLSKNALCSGALKRKRDHDLLTEDHIMRNQLVYDLVADISPLKVLIQLVNQRRSEKSYKRVVTLEKHLIVNLESSNCSGRSSFRRIWEGATISVEVKCKPAEDEALEVLASIEGMKSNVYSRELWYSHGCIETTKTALPPVTVPFWNVKITVDVPDDIVEPRLAQTNSIPAAGMILEGGSFSDVIITARNGAQIPSHRSFLSVFSPVFRTMFRTKMRESETGQVDMTDMSEHGVRAFLRFVYCGDLRMPKVDIEIAFELLNAGHKYLMSNLEAEMMKCLMEWGNEDFTVEMTFKMYLFTRNISTAGELKTKMVQILNGKLEEMQSLPEYVNVFQRTPSVAMEVFRDFTKPT